MDELLPLGYQISDATIIEHLERGGFGATYVCNHTRYGQAVLKELFPLNILHRAENYSLVLSKSSGESLQEWETIKKTFLAELGTLKQLKIEGIPRYYDSFRANGTIYILQEYIDGVSLHDYVNQFQQQGSNCAQVAEKLLKDLLFIMHQVHQCGILHRDIKPSNIVLRSSDGKPFVIDFGGVRHQIGGVTYNLDRRVWSPGYSSFEQLDTKGEGQEQKQASDLYSIAACFYFLLFNEQPEDSIDRFQNDDSGLKFLSLSGKYSGVFIASLERAFQLKQVDRFQTAGEWMAFLDGEKKMTEAPVGYHIAYWIGRNPTAREGGVPIAIDGARVDDKISRTHTVVYAYKGKYFIKDVSSNGLSVDDSGSGFVKISGGCWINSENFTLDLAGYRVKWRELLGKATAAESTGDVFNEAPTPAHVSHSAERQAPIVNDLIGKNEVELVYASFGRRAAAIFVDGLIFSILCPIVLLLFGLISFDAILSGGVPAPAVICLLIFYMAKVFLWAHSGYDFGKVVMRIKVVDRNTLAPPKFTAALLRCVGYFPSGLILYLGFLWMLWDDESQTWHDKFGGTIVVRDIKDKKVKRVRTA